VEEDPVLLADDRRHALLALTPLGRSVLAEFARQADYTKYVVHQVTRGKNPRAILRNPNTGAWMEMDKLPQGYDVQEGRVVKSQQASTPAVGQPSTPSATSGLADRLANLKTLGDASSHPQLSYDDLEKAARHQFQGLHRDDARQLALQMGIHGVKSGKEAQDKVVGLIHGRKGMAERLSVIDRPGYRNQEKNPHAQAALPRAQELVQEAKGTNEATAKNPLQSQQAKVQEATTGVQPPTPQDLHRITQENNQKAQALQAMQQHLDKAQQHERWADAHRQMGQAMLEQAKHYQRRAQPRADEIAQVAKATLDQAQGHLQQRQDHLEKAKEYARQAGVPEPRNDSPVLPSEKPVAPATNQDELLHQADRLDQQARLHDMEAVIKRAGPRQPVSALTPGDAALTQDWTSEQHSQHAVLLRDMARKTREEGAAPVPTPKPKVDMPSHADVLNKVHELRSGQMMHVAGVNIRKEDYDHYIVQGGGVMSHHSSPSPATSKARSLAKDLAQRPETDALKNERIMNNYLAKAREHHEKREEAAQARRNSEHQASLHEEAAKAQSLGASGGQWGKMYSLSQNQSKAAKAREKANQYREEERTHTQRRDGYLQDAKRYAMLSGNERMIPWISAEQYR
jgi:nucleotide-binding universal stress UspA family protein